MEAPHALDLVEQRLGNAKLPEERERLESIAANLEAGWTIRREALEKLTVAAAPQASMQSWRECLYATIADGTAVVTPAVATILVPDFTLPAAYLYPGRTLKYTLWGKMSSPITTPGTFTMSLRWGGVGGVVLATSGAWAPDPTAASTNVAWSCEYWMVCRSVGATGTALTFGKMDLNDIDDATVATLKAGLDQESFPDANAVVTIDTTIAKALSPCVTPSLTTGSVTCMMAVLEAIT
jgi:hypothetical protein